MGSSVGISSWKRSGASCSGDLALKYDSRILTKICEVGILGNTTSKRQIQVKWPKDIGFLLITKLAIDNKDYHGHPSSRACESWHAYLCSQGRRALSEIYDLAHAVISSLTRWSHPTLTDSLPCQVSLNDPVPTTLGEKYGTHTQTLSRSGSLGQKCSSVKAIWFKHHSLEDEHLSQEKCRDWGVFFTKSRFYLYLSLSPSINTYLSNNLTGGTNKSNVSNK